MRQIVLPLVVAGAIAAGVMAFRNPPIAERRTFGEPSRVCSITDNAIDESSGIAASIAVPGTYLTHNDSGDTARFFRFDLKGKVLATYSLEGVEAKDWEDIASARIGGRNYVYLGDTGDNQSKRTHVSIIRVEEPKGESRELSRFETFRIAYPDKPHDCECLMVHPKTGDIWLVTKVVSGPSQVFWLRAPNRSGDYTPKLMGTVEVGTMILGSQMVTAGDIAPDGKHVVLRSYSAAFEFSVPSRFEDWFKQKPERIRTAVENQGEAICYSRDGKLLLTTSEGTPCPVSGIPIKIGR